MRTYSLKESTKSPSPQLIEDRIMQPLIAEALNALFAQRQLPPIAQAQDSY